MPDTVLGAYPHASTRKTLRVTDPDSTEPHLDAASPTPDQLVPLSELPAFVPRRRGRMVHVATVHRWAAQGVHGERLRVVALGGQTCTTLAWVREWAERVAAARIPADVEARRPGRSERIR